MSRTNKAIKNAIYSTTSYIIVTALTFIQRKMFIQYLGYEFLGLNSLLSTIITTLCVVELGIGTAITFSLYKPIAENDTAKISLLVNLYKKIFRIIALIVLVIGLGIMPFLPALTKYVFTFKEVLPYYLLFLFNAIFTYMFTYNQTLLDADQKNYIKSFVNLLTTSIIIVLQIIVLILFKDYSLYLGILLVITMVSNILLSKFVKRKYPYIKNIEGVLGDSEVNKIKKNVNSLVFHKLGNYLVTGTDNLIISAFLGLTIVGYYSNYILITNVMTSLIASFFGGIVAGFGNLIVENSKETIFKVFKKAKFINFIFFTVASVGLYVLANDLLSMWLSSDTVMANTFLILFVINFYITGYSYSLGNLRAAAGAFEYDKYLHIIIAVLNLVISIILVNFIGILGVLLGTTISLIIKECIVLPRIGAKYIYGGKPKTYYLRFLFDFAVCVLIVVLSAFVYQQISIDNLLIKFFVGVVLCIVISLAIISAIYFKTDEFKYVVNLIKKISHKIFKIKGENKGMNIEKTKLDGVVILTPQAFGDNRGWFAETYNKEKLALDGIDYEFIQDNHSFSKDKGTLRGLHFQNHPYAQTKLVRCTKGSILDVAVDIRKGSKTFGEHVAIELTAENKKQLLIPKGFAHGFVTLCEDCEVQYKVDNVYSGKHDRSIQYDDPQFKIDWKVENPTLSEKDIKAPLFTDSDCNFSQKVLVTGVNGQLGYDVVKKLKSENYAVLGVDINDFDITDNTATLEFIKKYNPQVVVHCSAYTAVDKAESEKEICEKVNAEGAKNIAKACKEIDCKMVYISTDYVYEGTGNDLNKVTDKTNPLSVYGKTKLQGENFVKEILEKHFIIRTSWVFGKNGNNFIKTMLKLSETKKELNIVSDQIGSPTYTPDLSNLIFEMINSENYGVYNASNEGFVSWYEFARFIFTSANIDIETKPIKTSEYKTDAVRPLNSRLDKSKLVDNGFNRLPSWGSAVIRYLKEIK